MKRSDRNIILILALLILSALLACCGVYFGKRWIIILSSTALVILAWSVYNIYRRIRQELESFSQSVRYLDFSRKYSEKNIPCELKGLRRSFNEINHIFRNITREKETHHLYLQKTLSMIDTAIISFEEQPGTVNWMNESFNRLLDIPYLPTIHTLAKKYPELYNTIVELRSNDNKVVTIHHNNGAQKILLHSAAFKVENKIHKVVALQNINAVLDENESAAWSKLLSVMTHEIMNSIAPISSLAGTLSRRLKNEQHGDGSLQEDLQLGIDTIKRRSDGLLRFAESYHNLNKINKLNVTSVRIAEVFEDVSRLMEPMLQQKNIELDIIISNTSLEVKADRNLLEQVLINLVSNAIEALKETQAPRITFSAEEESKKILLKVADNGKGIPASMLEDIFVPFYTTRKNGTGIGLSLCKQIMLMHHGTITVRSWENMGTVFSMAFSKDRV